MLSTLCTGMGPLGSVSDVVQQVTLMSLIRFVIVGYLINFQRIIKQCSSLTKESSEKTEKSKKEE